MMRKKFGKKKPFENKSFEKNKQGSLEQFLKETNNPP